MSGLDWPGDERRRPPMSSSTGRSAPLAVWLQEEAAKGERYRVSTSVAARSRTTPSSPSRATEYIGVDVVREPGRRVARRVEDLPVEDAGFDLVLCTQVARALRRPEPGSSRAEARYGSRRARARLDARRQVYHPSPEDYWRWTHAGLRRLFTENRGLAVRSRCIRPGTASCLAMLLGVYTEIAFRRAGATAARARAGLALNSGADALDRRPRSCASLRPGSLTANSTSSRPSAADAALRRNAIGSYGVYAAAMSPGSSSRRSAPAIGDDGFGIWAFIGGITIYLPFSISASARRSSGSRPRRADGATREINRVASVASSSTRRSGVLTLPSRRVLAWCVPLLIGRRRDLVWEARVSTFLVRSRSPRASRSVSSTTCSAARHRFDLQNLGNFVGTVLYAVLVALLIPRRRLVLLGS
jgi:hypothetical protein